MKYYIKIITGFREDQYTIIPMQEAHKAYYLFKHPEERGVFENGVAIIGRNIQEIKPAWNETMGYNSTHELDDDDWNEIRIKGVEEKMKLLIDKASHVAKLAEDNKSLIGSKLQNAIEQIKPSEEMVFLDESIKKLSNKFTVKST